MATCGHHDDGDLRFCDLAGLTIMAGSGEEDRTDKSVAYSMGPYHLHN